MQMPPADAMRDKSESQRRKERRKEGRKEGWENGQPSFVITHTKKHLWGTYKEVQKKGKILRIVLCQQNQPLSSCNVFEWEACAHQAGLSRRCLLNTRDNMATPSNQHFTTTQPALCWRLLSPQAGQPTTSASTKPSASDTSWPQCFLVFQYLSLRYFVSLIDSSQRIHLFIYFFSWDGWIQLS